MNGFDTVVVVDWSARAKPSPAKPSKDAIFIAFARSDYTAISYQRTRGAAMRFLVGLIEAERRAGRRILLGFDFPFGYPLGFARVVAGSDDPLTLWGVLAGLVRDGTDNANNRFEVAAELNRRCGAQGPFWGRPKGQDIAGLSFLKPPHTHPFAERRAVERAIPRAKTCFQLMGAGSVGSQALLGIAHLQALRARYGAALAVAPFEAPDRADIVLAEVYPGLIPAAIAAHARPEEIPDRAQVRVLARALSRLRPERLDALLRVQGALGEGWILGARDEDALAAALA